MWFFPPPYSSAEVQRQSPRESDSAWLGSSQEYLTEGERERVENVCRDYGAYTVRRKVRTMEGVVVRDYEKMLVIKI